MQSTIEVESRDHDNRVWFRALCPQVGCDHATVWCLSERGAVETMTYHVRVTKHPTPGSRAAAAA